MNNKLKRVKKLCRWKGEVDVRTRVRKIMKNVLRSTKKQALDTVLKSKKKAKEQRVS